MPLSYAAGCAIASDFEGSTRRELFRHADKNMYVDKNRANREEAEARKLQNQQLLQWVNAHGYQFSNCLYCDALLDQYRVLRTSSGFFLADNGSYSGAVEQDRGRVRRLRHPQDNAGSVAAEHAVCCPQC